MMNLSWADAVEPLDPTPELIAAFTKLYPEDPRAWSKACSAAFHIIWGSLSPRIKGLMYIEYLTIDQIWAKLESKYGDKYTLSKDSLSQFLL